MATAKQVRRGYEPEPPDGILPEIDKQLRDQKNWIEGARVSAGTFQVTENKRVICRTRQARRTNRNARRIDGKRMFTVGKEVLRGLEARND